MKLISVSTRYDKNPKGITIFGNEYKNNSKKGGIPKVGLYGMGKKGLFAAIIVLCFFTAGILGLTAPAWGNEQVATTAIDGDDQPQAINTDDTTWAWECNPDDQSANETADNPQRL